MAKVPLFGGGAACSHHGQSQMSFVTAKSINVMIAASPPAIST
jgi:hypothetical protein